MILSGSIPLALQSGSELQRRDVKQIFDADVELDSNYIRQWATQLGVSELMEQIQE